jgi:ATP-binding cassette subfamily B multidrug efflux pump
MLKLFRFLRPYHWNVFCILLFLFSQAMAELYLPTLMSNVVNNGMMRGNTGYIWRYGSYMLLVALGSGLSAIVGSFLSSVTAIGVARDLRNTLFTRVEGYSFNGFDQIGAASLINRTTNDITQVQILLVMGMRFMVFAPIMCVGGIVMAISRDKALAWILAFVLPIMLMLIGLLAHWLVPLFKLMQVKLDTVNRVLRENLTGIRVIRAFDRQRSESKRFTDANRDLTQTSITVNKIMGVIQPFMLFSMNVTMIAIIWFGGLRISQNNMQIGDMMAFLQYAIQIMFSIIMVTVMFVMVPRAEASAIRINEALELKPEIFDPEQPTRALNKEGLVEFRDVTFSYAGAVEPAIRNISFNASPGEFTAIIGGTGSGKSTMINLIPRFYDADSGSVLVDGMDVRTMAQQDLRAKIGFVPQTPILFSGTIAENIRYGKDDATDEEVAYAADIAQAAEFITAMPDGFNSRVAQGGANFSGGQKQRLSIARAVVRKPEIYIFDDSFSALDFKTDARLRSALRKETRNSTVILIAQRVSTVMGADRIIVLDKGRIVGMGTHKQLMDTSVIYREIASSQLSEEELA